MISSSGTSPNPSSVSMPFKYLMGFPLGSWIIRKAIMPSVDVAGNILTGTRTRERRRLPDQTGIGAMGQDTQEVIDVVECGTVEDRRKVNKMWISQRETPNSAQEHTSRIQS